MVLRGRVGVEGKPGRGEKGGGGVSRLNNARPLEGSTREGGAVRIAGWVCITGRGVAAGMGSATTVYDMVLF